MPQRIRCTDEEWAAFEHGLAPFESQGLERFRKEIRHLLAEGGHGDIANAFADDFPRVSLRFTQWFGRRQHAGLRHAQLAAGKFGFYVYRCYSGESCSGRHGELDGIVLPSDHPFWMDHVAPNDWLCACYVLGARSERGAARLGGQLGKIFPANWRDGRFVSPPFRGNNLPSTRDALEAILDGSFT